MIHVCIKLSGPLRNYYKSTSRTKGERVKLPEGSRMADLLAHYRVPPEKVHVITINRRKADLDTPLKDEDEIRMIPLAAGG